jgi:hypothetical protein
MQIYKDGRFALILINVAARSGSLTYSAPGAREIMDSPAGSSVDAKYRVFSSVKTR